MRKTSRKLEKNDATLETTDSKQRNPNEPYNCTSSACSFPLKPRGGHRWTNGLTEVRKYGLVFRIPRKLEFRRQRMKENGLQKPT